jgi:DNA-binding NarL/FixJ family response regulator
MLSGCYRPRQHPEFKLHRTILYGINPIVGVGSEHHIEGDSLADSGIRVLVVEDYEQFRRFLSSMLQGHLGIQIIGEASNGEDAVELAKKLQPDVILLDIGLPKLNGMEAGRQVRELSPQSKIIFVSQESSRDIVQETFNLGARGYVLKVDAGSDLLAAVDAASRGERFLSRSLAGQSFTLDVRVPEIVPRKTASRVPQRIKRGIGDHEAHFYSDDASLLDGFTQFIGRALKAGNAVIVVATELHRNSLLPRLQAYGLNIGSAIEQGRYIALDAAETLSTLLVDDQLNAARFLETARNLVTTAAKAARGEHPRVAICGECEPPLWTLGQGEAAIRLEQLWNEIAERFDVDILCGYPLSSFHGKQSSEMYERICAEHAAVFIC